MTDAQVVDWCLRVARRWYGLTPAAAVCPDWSHYWWPAYERCRPLAARLPADPLHARRLVCRAAWFGCVDELRRLRGRGGRYRAAVRERPFADLDDPVSGWRYAGAVPDRDRPDPPERRLAAVWADTRAGRAAWGWRERVWLYLWVVEGWPLERVGAAWGVTATRVTRTLRPVLAGRGSGLRNRRPRGHDCD